MAHSLLQKAQIARLTSSFLILQWTITPSEPPKADKLHWSNLVPDLESWNLSHFCVIFIQSKPRTELNPGIFDSSLSDSNPGLALCNRLNKSELALTFLNWANQRPLALSLDSRPSLDSASRRALSHCAV